MNKSSRLKPIAKIRKQAADVAGRQYGEFSQQAEVNKKQLDELKNYRQQYLNSFQAASKSGLTAIQMQQYNHFINRLDDVIKQQKQNVFNAQSQCDIAYKHWLSKRCDNKVIDKLIESRQQLEKQQQEKKEQKELEDRPQIAMFSHLAR